MDTSDWRVRVMLEPRGFIRFIEFILAIVAFATTGGYTGHFSLVIRCNETNTHDVDGTVTYPFRLDAIKISFTFCNGTTNSETKLNGDFSPSSQWFVFVGVTAFLYSLASMIFYVIFDAKVRQSHEKLVTIGDLAGTVLYAFFWLTAASAWAWGVGQVKHWTLPANVIQNDPLFQACKLDGKDICTHSFAANYGPLNASVAFGFLNFFLWVCNVWFVYKESPYHQEPEKIENPAGSQSSAIPNNM